MGTIEISTIFSFSAPFILLYNVWLHNQIVKAQIDIAVNTSKDEAITKSIDLLRTSMDNLTAEVHSINKQSNGS